MSGIINNGDETTATILDKLKGAAADATRIGAEYMPETLETVLIELATVPVDTILPANNLGADPNGNPVIGDGVTSGGLQIATPSKRRFHGLKYITSGELSEAGTGGTPIQKSLGSFAIPASKAVVGTKIRMVGRYLVEFDGAAVSTYAVGLTKSGYTPTSGVAMVSVRPNMGSSNQPISAVFDFEFELVEETPSTSNLKAQIVTNTWPAHIVFPATINDSNFGLTPTGTPTYSTTLVNVEVAPNIPSATFFTVAKNTSQSLPVFFVVATSAINTSSTGGKCSYDFELEFS